MRKIYLEESTILNFMSLVLGIRVTFDQGYDFAWKEPAYNFYVKKYRIEAVKNELWIRWINLQDKENLIVYRKPKYRHKFLNWLYYKTHKRLETTDFLRFENVLKTVVYPHFCEDLELIDTDFSNEQDKTSAADHVLCSIYSNFFCRVSVERYIDIFSLDKLVSKQSLLKIKETCDKIFLERRLEDEKVKCEV